MDGGFGLGPQTDAVVAGAEVLALDADPVKANGVAEKLHLRQLDRIPEREHLAGVLQRLADIQCQPNTP